MPERETIAPAWIAVIGGRKARLFETLRLPHGRTRLRPVGELADDWEEKEHARPCRLAGRGRSFATGRREAEERARRFAKRSVRWIGERLRRGSPVRVAVFAAPSMFGLVRKLLPAPWLERIVLHKADFARLGPVALASQAAVTEAAV